MCRRRRSWRGPGAWAVAVDYPAACRTMAREAIGRAPRNIWLRMLFTDILLRKQDVDEAKDQLREVLGIYLEAQAGEPKAGGIEEHKQRGRLRRPSVRMVRRHDPSLSNIPLKCWK